MAIVPKRRGKRKGSRTPLPKIEQGLRTSKADTLKAAAASYFLKGGYSCFYEMGVNSWGKLRADMLGVNLRRRIVICEIKSSRADYCTDTKWKQYLDFCNKFYIVMSPLTFKKLKVRLLKDLRGTGAGVMVLNPTTGYLDVVIACKNREIDEEVSMSLITRMAWRGGISKRTNRRTRQFLTETRVNEDQTEGLEEQIEEEVTKRKRAVRRKRRAA